MYFYRGKTNSCGVLGAFYGNVNVVDKNQFNDDNGKILILEVTISNTKYLLVNFYNTNTEQEHLKTLQNLSVMLENFDSFCSNNVIIAGDFNLFFSKKLECKGGDPYFKCHSVNHIIKIYTRKQNHSLSDKNIFLVLYSVDWIIYSFQTFFKKQFLM